MVGGERMRYQKIVQEIGHSLLKGGNCPYDAGCPFGQGISCSANQEELIVKKNNMKQDIQSKYPGNMITQCDSDTTSWPCNDISFIIVRFVDPDIY